MTNYSQDSHLIEIIGLPGSGKTTLANNISKDMVICKRAELSSLNQPSCQLVNQYYVAKNLLRYSKFVLKPSKNKLNRISRYLELMKLNPPNGCITVLDQHLLQVLWSFHLVITNPKYYKIPLILSNTPKYSLPKAVIYIDADCDEAASRVYNRPGTCKFSTTSQSKNAQLFSSTTRYFEFVMFTLNQLDIPFLVIHKNTSPVDASAESITFIKDIL